MGDLIGVKKTLLAARVRYEWRLFLTALMFLTRLPVSAGEHCDAWFAASVSYFPLVGWLVGAVGAAFYYVGLLYWSAPVAAVLALSAMVIITGGFHEDGLADTADGFGGGWTPERKLEIMKDSRLGTYGSLALMLMLLLKFSLVQVLTLANIAPVLCIAHGLSRWSVLPLLRYNRYVSASAHHAGLVGSHFSSRRFMLGTLLAWTPLLVWQPLAFLPLAVLLLLLLWGWQWWCRRQVGGITGDTLGAANQLVEVAVYLFCVACFL